MADRDAILEALAEHSQKLDTVIAERLMEKGQFSGAIWALSRVGASVVSFMALLGFLAVHGVPQWVKDIFR